MTKESEFDEEQHEKEDVSHLFLPHVMRRRARNILAAPERHYPGHVRWAEELLGEDIEMAREAERLGPAFMQLTAERENEEPGA